MKRHAKPPKRKVLGKRPKLSEVKKPLIITAITLGAVIVLALLVYFSPQFVGKAYTGTLNTAGIEDQTVTPGTFTVPIKANLGSTDAVAVSFDLTYPTTLQVDCTNIFQILDDNFVIGTDNLVVTQEYTCSNGQITFEYAGLCADKDCSNALSGEMSVAEIQFTGTPGTYDFNFTSFDIFDVSNNPTDLIANGESATITIETTPPVCDLANDDDGDGFGDDPGCVPLDCNDNDATIYPGASEICDDTYDNDCDGLIDDADPDCAECALGQTQDCDTGRPGVCQEGTQSCTSGVAIGSFEWGLCTPKTPQSTETCDGLDNDCDGEVDEGGVCDPACVPSPEICNNNLDEDCDNLIDCKDPNCQFNQAAGANLCWEETCNDGLDNDNDDSSNLLFGTDGTGVNPGGTINTSPTLGDPVRPDLDEPLNVGGGTDCGDSDCAQNPVCLDFLSLIVTNSNGAEVNRLVKGETYTVTANLNTKTLSLPTHLFFVKVIDNIDDEAVHYEAGPALGQYQQDSISFNFVPPADAPAEYTIKAFVWSNWLSLNGRPLVVDVEENYAVS